MVRKYRVEGTKDFLYAAILIFALGVWAIKDGWFPSAGVLERHPRHQSLAFEEGGIVADIRVEPDDEVKKNQTLVVLQRADLDQRLTALDRNLKLLEDELALAGAAAPALAEQRAADRARWTAEIAEVRDAMLLRELKATHDGYITAVFIERDGIARPKAPVVELLVKDHFYAFNKSLAVLCMIGSVVCLFIHIKVK